MDDWLKLETDNLLEISNLLNNPLLHWVSDFDKLKYNDDQEITTRKIKEYKGIYFCFYSEKLDILFKPHYYFNNNLHNANDFKIIDCIAVIKEVKSTLNIDLKVFKVVNIEYGINYLSPIDVKNLITYFAYHSTNEFRTDTGLPFSKKSYSFKPNGTANGYKTIKSYAKGIQFPNYCNKDTARFEVKSKKSKYIKTLGIYNADDLLNVNVYFAMAKSLMIEFENTLILDCETDFTSLTQKDQNKISKFNNPMEWYKIINSTNRNSFSKKKIEYYKLINKVPDNLKNKLRKIFLDKLEILKKGAILQPHNEIKKSAILQEYIGQICTKNKTQITKNKNSICPVTGLSLCNEKEGAKYALTTTLKKLKESDPTSFELVKLNLLNGSRKKPKFEQSEMLHLTKQIRNNYFNSFKIKQRGYNQPLCYFQHSQLNFLSTLGV